MTRNAIKATLAALLLAWPILSAGADRGQKGRAVRSSRAGVTKGQPLLGPQGVVQSLPDLKIVAVAIGRLRGPNAGRLKGLPNGKRS